MFATELIHAYPDAKIILNMRPREEWYRSIVKSVDAKMRSRTGWIMSKFDSEMRSVRSITFDSVLSIPFLLLWSGFICCSLPLYTLKLYADIQLRSNINRCWSKANGHYFRWDLARNGKHIYDEHAALVRGAAVGNQFLEYDPHQGWEPLCTFLDRPIPKESFPSGNVAQEFHSRIETCMRSRFVRAMRNLGVTCLIGMGAGLTGYMGWATWLE